MDKKCIGALFYSQLINQALKEYPGPSAMRAVPVYVFPQYWAHCSSNFLLRPSIST